MQSYRLPLATAVAAALLAASGCLLQPNVSVRITVADGTSMDVPFTSIPPPATDGVVTIKNFQFAPWDVGKDKPKSIAFTFVVGFAEGAEPASIVVEDFTEQPVLEIFSDMNAHVVKDHLWGSVSRPFAPQDEHVKWVLNLDNNVRVYRFTI